MKTLTLMNAAGQILEQATGVTAVSLTYERAYKPGDHLVMESDEPLVYAGVDAFLSPAYLYLPEGRLDYIFPTAEDELLAYNPLAFRAGVHTAFISGAAAVKDIRRDLALNPLCRRQFAGAYPFIQANV